MFANSPRGFGRSMQGLTVGAAVAAAIAGFSAAPVHAQDAAADSEIVEVMVTARRRAESLQDVPIAVSSF